MKDNRIKVYLTLDDVTLINELIERSRDKIDDKNRLIRLERLMEYAKDFLIDSCAAPQGTDGSKIN